MLIMQNGYKNKVKIKTEQSQLLCLSGLRGIRCQPRSLYILQIILKIDE